MKNHTNRYRLLLILASAIFFTVNLYTIYDGNNWGDDFAQYLLHAKNLAQGRPYSERIMLDLPTVISPGYPLLLTPFIKFFGINLPLLKSLNIPFWFVFSFFHYLMMRRLFSRETAVFGFLGLLSLPFFFVFKQNTLSDIPFACFIACASYFFLRHEELRRTPSAAWQKHLSFAVFICFLFYSFLIRPAAIALFLATALYSLRERQRRQAFFILLALLAAFLMQTAFGSSSAQYLREFPDTRLFQVNLFNERIPSVTSAVLFGYFFPPSCLSTTLPGLAILKAVILRLSHFLFFIMSGIFIYQAFKKNISFIAYFFFFYIIGMILWPVPGGDERYALPLFGIILILWFKTFSFIYEKIPPPLLKNGRQNSKKFLKYFVTILALYNIAGTVDVFPFNDDVIRHPLNQEMIIWIKTHVKENEHFMYWKPRALALFTQRVGTAPWLNSGNPQDWPRRIKQFDIRYIVLSKNSDQMLMDGLQAAPWLAKVAFENDLYKVFTIKPELMGP